MQDLDNRSKNLLKIVVIGILLYFGFYYISNVSKAFATLYAVLQPFILGGALAFIISIPMNFFERKLHKIFKTQDHKKLISTVSLIVSWILVIGFLVILINILVPSMIKVIYTFSMKWPDFVREAAKILEKYPATEPFADKLVENFSGISWINIRNAIFNFLKGNEVDLFDTATSFINSVSSGVIGIFTMVVFSIFVLVYKKLLKANGTKFLYALFKEDRADYINKVFSLSYNTFKDYLFSRLISVVCLTTLTFIGMKIFDMPNAPMISVIIGLSDLIPIFGPIFGTGFAVILIFVESPVKALIFLAYNLVIQQIQENFIFPAIAGDAIGLPAVWVMASVTIGGSLFGIWGMLISIPVVSVVYSLVHEQINHRLKDKSITKEGLREKIDKSYTIDDLDIDNED